MLNYKFQSWIRFFKERAQYRTLCVDCSEMIQDYHHKLRRRNRQQEMAQDRSGLGQATWASRGNPEATSPGPDSHALSRSPDLPLSWLATASPEEKEEKRAKIRQLAPGPRAIITHWISLVKTK